MIVEQVNQDFVAALKAGDKPKAEALRLLKSAFTNSRIQLGHDLTDQEALKVIKKEMKSRVEARDMFQKNNRLEQAAQEELERSVYASYAPAELTDQELNEIINQVASSSGTEANFGQIIGLVMKKVDGRADGSRVSALVKQHLAD